MNVGIVTHRVVKGDGQGRVNYETALEALRRGHRVTLVATMAAPALTARDAVTWIPIPVAGWPTALLRNQIFAWHSTRWLRRYRTHLDVLQVNGCITWEPGDVNAAHFVHSAWLRSPFHTARIEQGPTGWYQWLYTYLNARWERTAFDAARAIVAVSDRVRDELESIGVPADRIRIIPNGVDLDEFAPGAADRAALGLPERVPLGLFIGDLRTPRKNLDTVLHALVQVPDLHLAVAGDVKESPYPALARQIGVLDRVHFLGFRRDVAALMRAADLCVCPSRYEPFSLVLLEALASGLPVVTARTVGAVQVMTDACGIVIDDTEDANALAQALARLSGNPEQRAAMGRAARTVAEPYSWTHVARHYVDLFEALCPTETAC